MNCMFIHTATCSKWTACCGSGTASTKPWFILPRTKLAESFLIECCSMLYVALCSFFFSCTFLTHFISSFLLIHQGILAFCSAFICLFVCFLQKHAVLSSYKMCVIHRRDSISRVFYNFAIVRFRNIHLKVNIHSLNSSNYSFRSKFQCIICTLFHICLSNWSLLVENGDGLIRKLVVIS